MERAASRCAIWRLRLDRAHVSMLCAAAEPHLQASQRLLAVPETRGEVAGGPLPGSGKLVPLGAHPLHLPLHVPQLALHPAPPPSSAGPSMDLTSPTGTPQKSEIHLSLRLILSDGRRQAVVQRRQRRRASCTKVRARAETCVAASRRARAEAEGAHLRVAALLGKCSGVSLPVGLLLLQGCGSFRNARFCSSQLRLRPLLCGEGCRCTTVGLLAADAGLPLQLLHLLAGRTLKVSRSAERY